jgi:preprotein translocase subunit SecF
MTNKIRTFNFMKRAQAASILSAALILIALISIFSRGLNFGVDFTGGVVVEAGFSEEIDLQLIRNLLTDEEFSNALVQNFGSATDVLIRLEPQDNMDGAAIRDTVLSIISVADPLAELRRVDFVGPQVGQDLTEQGSLAMLFALILIFFYVTFRFKWKFAVGALGALIHDVLILVGFFSLTQINFDLTILAAVLATIGYSLNDTIVVFDRIRENFKLQRGADSYNVINLSINQMLTRTIITSGTTLVVLLALFYLGGETVSGFALALIVGIAVGTYSSIFVAGTIIFRLNITAMDFAERKREAIDDLP